MGKCGVRAFEESSSDIMPYRVIAERLGLSIRTVHSLNKSAIQKLMENPESFEALNTLLRIKRQEQRGLMQCASVECNVEFIATYGAPTNLQRRRKKHERTSHS